jgi:hypothetical protein
MRERFVITGARIHASWLILDSGSQECEDVTIPLMAMGVIFYGSNL